VVEHPAGPSPTAAVLAVPALPVLTAAAAPPAMLVAEAVLPGRPAGEPPTVVAM
jgi:hypothetical protein